MGKEIENVFSIFREWMIKQLSWEYKSLDRDWVLILLNAIETELYKKLIKQNGYNKYK